MKILLVLIKKKKKMERNNSVSSVSIIFPATLEWPEENSALIGKTTLANLPVQRNTLPNLLNPTEIVFFSSV